MTADLVSDEQLAELGRVIAKLDRDEYNQGVPKGVSWWAQRDAGQNWLVIQPTGREDYRIIAEGLREEFAEFIATTHNLLSPLVRAALRDARDENERIREAVLAEIGSWTHEVVEDCWYTCPAATGERDGGECCNDATRGGECGCGLEHRRERIRAALAAPTGQKQPNG